MLMLLVTSSLVLVALVRFVPCTTIPVTLRHRRAVGILVRSRAVGTETGRVIVILFSSPLFPQLPRVLGNGSGWPTCRPRRSLCPTLLVLLDLENNYLCNTTRTTTRGEYSFQRNSLCRNRRVLFVFLQ